MSVQINGTQHIKVLYLVDRKSNSIERRIFRPGLLHKLASSKAKEYISNIINIEYPATGSVAGQITEIRAKTEPMIREAQRIQAQKHADLVDPPRYGISSFQKVRFTGNGIKFGLKEFSFSDGGGFSAASNELKLIIGSNGKKYVLKKMPDGTRARNEIGLIRGLHENRKTGTHIVTFQQVGISGKDLYVVMPYMDGPDCSKLIEKLQRQEARELSRVGARGLLMSLGTHRLRETRTKEIKQAYLKDKILLCQMAVRSVRPLSDQGIVHNDMKWENILYGNGKTCVTDLELAKLTTEDLIKGHRLRDNPRLKAPEIVLAENEVLDWKHPQKFTITPAVDVWSLGIMFCELLLGTNPFDRDGTPFGTDIEAEIGGHRAGALNSALFDCLTDDVRQDAEVLINSMLNPDPKERITIEKVLESSLFSLVAGKEKEGKARLHRISTGTVWSGEAQRRRPLRNHQTMIGKRLKA
ncbi:MULTISPECIES: protein kinase [unclassified Rhizobacter]|uniref:protein kinase domain-containing protein n=1 Tax=unclassified Rhizobacter TaxID=2640088 RepID=UPI0009E9CA12|nr:MULTISPECIES: protein kinase [unclassified Rhizobacter]